MTWEQTEVRGQAPQVRYGHAMETLPHSGLMLMYGGRTDNGEDEGAFSDMWELRYLHSTLSGRVVLQWTEIRVVEGLVPPCVRMQMAAHGTDMLVYGGSACDLHSVSSCSEEEIAAAADPVRHRQVLRLCPPATPTTESSEWTVVPADPLERFSNGAPLDPDHQDSDDCENVQHSPLLEQNSNSLAIDLLNCCRVDLPSAEGAARIDNPDPSAYVRLVFEEEQQEESGGGSELDESPRGLAAPVTLLAPRALLAVRNAMFRAMLGSNMTESVSGCVTLRSPSAYCSLSLLVFLLTDIVAVRAEDVLDLLALANQYSFAGLMRQCEFILCRQCDGSNALDLLAYAEGYQMPTLRECCLTNVLMHWTAFAPMLGPSNETVGPAEASEAIGDEGGEGEGGEVLHQLLRRLRSEPGHIFGAALEDLPLPAVAPST